MEFSSKDPGSTVEDCRLAIRTQSLEKAYDNTLVHTAQLLDAEKNRLLRVEQLLLRFENENLRWQLNHVNQELTKTARKESEVRLQLQATYKELDQLRSAHHTSSHEIETLRLELGSLANSSVDVKKLLAEKHHLSRVLSSAGADVERLKSQKTSQHTLLAEKRNLEQQVTILEVQLENEKKAHEQAVARESHNAEQVAALSLSLEGARSELMEEARARDGRERVFQQQNMEWAAQRAALDAKLDALNKKLHSTKDQYQAAATELKRQYDISNNHESKFSSAQSITQHNSGLTIATPGAIRAQDKRSKTSTLPGEKSSFSITPFLNRTNGLRNSATSSGDDADELHTTHMTSKTNQKASENDVQKCVNSGYQGQRPSVDELPVTVDTLRLGHGTSNGRKGGQFQRKLLDNSDPEGRMENASGIFTRTSNHGQFKSRKRKLGTQRDLGLFDEDDDEDTHDIRRPGRKLVSGGTGRNFASQASAPSGSRLGRSRGLGGLGEFSPLKRDKKRL
ncbi:hypothetical protein BDV37DRAFT_257916 [Aspergillus pseudonomiae]|uniref:Uncharacterized protein n=1 Tax=Aspergillus pseudonomiae TaxID=1506151 RepID=A0A5N7D3J2_9EURO|nr:uncharacterized protein BDV37DRAFT_257916 [Aspergillus pseudonomiae]KAE8400433.1 hypothetical protein BDV37DRAFT_257916 [Aspergillus pseudonomiae]